MSLSSHTGGAGAAEESSPAPASKRRRLNLACNYCRSRKTRCDEQKPSCHACLAAGLVCITTDPRKPERRVERREAGKKPSHHRLSSVVSQTPSYTPVQQQTANSASPEETTNTPLEVVELEPTAARDVVPERPQTADVNDNTTGERFRGLLPIFKYDVSSSTVEILTGWLNVAFFRLGHKQRFKSRSPQGAKQSYALLCNHTPKLPNPLLHQSWVSNYFQRVHTVYPVLNKEEVLSDLNMMQTHGIETFFSNLERLPHIVAALVVLQLGSHGHADTDPDNSEVFIVLKDLLGRLIGHPSIPNIKALFLSAINVYQHDDLTSAWSILSLCISMATSLRLGKTRVAHQSTPSHDEDNRRRIWWSICVFEKFLAFEMGRHSAISVDDLSQYQPTVASSPQSAEESSDREDIVFFKAITGLAKLLGDIGSRCVQIREQEEVSDRTEIQKLVAEKVKITGEACLQLTKWAEDLPNHLRPGSDLIYDPATFPHAAFLSIHYHNALLVLTRNSILISESALRVTTEVVAKDQPWRHMIRNGPPMVANTARKIIKLFIEAEENEISLLIPHTNACLHALYILAVHLTKHPTSMLAKTDLNVGSPMSLSLLYSPDLVSFLLSIKGVGYKQG